MMTQPALSIVVPVFNEAATIGTLIQRVDAALTTAHLSYELIIIDDHSTDQTVGVLSQLRSQYPISVYRKQTPERGKGSSLLAGFKQAAADIVVMIDGDLQYPPEAIPAMYEKMQAGADLVVAERVKKSTSAYRQLTSGIFRTFFVKVLHGVSVDAQSGLKMFRTEILERVTLHPTTWSFDLELVIKAQWAGYSIASVPITFERRRHRKSTIKVAKTAMEIGGKALSLKTQRPDAIPFTAAQIQKEGHGFHYKGQKYIPHSQLSAHETALYRLAHNQRLFLTLLLVFFGGWLFFNWHSAIVVIVALLTILYFSDLLFNFYLIYRSFSKSTEITVSKDEIEQVQEWPTYTIFCPLYKEPEVIPQFVSAMNELDYPKDKLQIMLLLEQDDTISIQKAQSLTLPSYFQIVVVPHSMPKTKPKACNYGLIFARGEHCVIYDAEDVPDKDQLKKAVVAFRKNGTHVACVQAKLNFYNPHQNLLTRAFTAEYSLWFDLVLTGLQSINAPIPLGGTSNHFRTQQLRDLNGWDAFNVTEDCDLGMRLVKRGFMTGVLDSTTLEEANSDLPNWFRQRSRWIKGYMQTYLVHMRRPKEFLRHWTEPHVITFQLVVGGKILSMFINPLMWLITILYFLLRAHIGNFVESFFPTPVLYMGVFSFIFGNFLYLYYYMIGCAKREQYELIKFAYLIPFYWLAMSMAAWLAFKELIVRPHHWAKTQHGLHLNNKQQVKKVQENIGRDLVSSTFAVTTQ